MDRPALRLLLARTLAWALLLGGWIGLGSVSQRLTSGPLLAFALVALWLLVLGVGATVVGRWRATDGAMRGLMAGMALMAVIFLDRSVHGGGGSVLALAWVAWAGLVVLASATVRASRKCVPLRPPPPVGAAAAGAALVWLLLGDLGDVNGLVWRLAAVALGGGAALMALWPRRGSVHGGCRAGLFDCSLPNGSAQAWRLPARRPVWLASLVMLPMMCGLPWMIDQCRADGVSAPALLGLHLAAMFLPALWAVRQPAWWRWAAGGCAALLVLGALAAWGAPGARGALLLAVAHGAAWSLAWAAHLADPPPARGPSATPAVGAAFNAILALALGGGVALAGLQALTLWHEAIGLTAGVASLAAWVRWPQGAALR